MTSMSATSFAKDVATVSIDGGEVMTFGPTTDTPSPNKFTLVVTDKDGKTICEDGLRTIDAGYHVAWDIRGFKTDNDQKGQYCDSYGNFVNNEDQHLTTTFELRNVPMNFYGILTATLTLGGKTYKAEKRVVALGNARVPETQVLPMAGYPKRLNDYRDELLSTAVLKESHGQGQDMLFGRWIVAGSDPTVQAVLCQDADSTKYLRLTAPTLKSSHVLAKSIVPPTSVMTFTSRVRFHSAGAVITLTSRFPFWSSVKLYTNPVTMRYDGQHLTINGTPLSHEGAPVVIKKEQWYDIVLSVDKRDKTCEAKVATLAGDTIAVSGKVKWTETSKPDFFNIGLASDATGSIDIAQCEAVCPNASAERKNIAVEKGAVYNISVTYQGVLTTGYINSDLAGYTLGTHDTLATETFTIAMPRDVLDLRISADSQGIAKIDTVIITKQAPRTKRAKRKVHHIGDSTSANSGSWAWRLEGLLKGELNVVDEKKLMLDSLLTLCDFSNKGAGGRNLGTYYQQGRLAAALLDIYPGDVVILGNNGTNGMNSTFEEDVNYYIDAAEAMGAQVVLNSYTPHGAVGSHAKGYDSGTHTFNSYRQDAYDVIVRHVDQERVKGDSSYLGFIEIGRNADAIFNVYVKDYQANGYPSADAAAQTIIGCFKDHNHYNQDSLACDLMLFGYSTCQKPGIVKQIIARLTSANHQYH